MRTRVFPKRGAGERGLHILLAEDNPVNARLAVRMLERLGHHVDHVENGFQALRAMCQGAHDVVLMDLQMPEMDGLETTRCYRATGGTTLVVALTATANSSDAEACREAGMDGYLSKPVDPRELERVLARIAAA